MIDIPLKQSHIEHWVSLDLHVNGRTEVWCHAGLSVTPCIVYMYVLHRNNSTSYINESISSMKSSRIFIFFYPPLHSENFRLGSFMLFFYITHSLCDDRCPRWTYTVVHNVFVRHTITAAIQLQFFYGSGRPGGIFLTTISQLKLHKAKPILFQEMFKATIVCVNTIKYWHKYSGFHWHSAWSMWQLLWIKLSHFITHNAQVFCILQTRRFFSTGVKSDLLQV